MKARTDWGGVTNPSASWARCARMIHAETSGFGYAAMASATLASIPLRVIFE